MVNPKMSNAGRWVYCPASARLEAQYPDVPSESKQEGIVAHDMAADCLRSKKQCGDSDINLYLDAVLQFHREPLILYVEREVTLFDTSGIIDSFFYEPDTKHLRIFELKFGRSLVEAEENYQMLCYAAALSEQVEVNTVSMTVVQPRGYHRLGPVRTWTIDGEKLKFYTSILKNAYIQAKAPENIACTGFWCSKCKALSGCFSAEQAASNAIDYMAKGETYDIEDPLQLEAELEIMEAAKRAIDLRYSAIATLCEQNILTGKMRFRNWEVGPGQGRKNWANSGDVLRAGEALGIDLRKPEAPVSITEAKRLGLAQSVIDMLVGKKPGKITLRRSGQDNIKDLYKGER